VAAATNAIPVNYNEDSSLPDELKNITDDQAVAAARQLIEQLKQLRANSAASAYHSSADSDVFASLRTIIFLLEFNATSDYDVDVAVQRYVLEALPSTPTSVFAADGCHKWLASPVFLRSTARQVKAMFGAPTSRVHPQEPLTFDKADINSLGVHSLFKFIVLAAGMHHITVFSARDLEKGLISRTASAITLKIMSVVILRRISRLGNAAKSASALVSQRSTNAAVLSGTRSVAVIGIGAWYPGAQGVRELWENIVARRRQFRRMLDQRMPLDDYGSPDHADKTYGTLASFIDGFQFDLRKWRINKQKFESTDMAHWLSMEVALQALRDANYCPATPSGNNLIPHQCKRMAVIVGNTLTGETSRAGSNRLRWPYVRRALQTAAKSVLSAEAYQKKYTSGTLPKGFRMKSVQDDAKVDPTTSYDAEEPLTGEAHIDDLVAKVREEFLSSFPETTEDTLAGGLSNTIAGHISKHWGMQGGCYSVDGACASSLIAVALACDGLLTRQIDSCLVGGVDISLDPFELVGFSRAGALSSGDMRVYGKDRSGFLPGEGCGFAVLVRLDDAVRLGHRVHACIEGWSMSSDGTGGIMAPAAAGQALAISRAYEHSPYSMDEVAFVEGHGTGTKIGDVEELTAIDTVVAESGGIDRQCGVTSFKALVGHTKAASGIAGFLKTVLGVNQRILPPLPNIDVNKPAECFEQCSRLYPIVEGVQLPPHSSVTASCSAMGFGGINVHVTMRSASPPVAAWAPRAPVAKLLVSNQDAELFAFTAISVRELIDTLEAARTIAKHMSIAEMTDYHATLMQELEQSQGSVRCAFVAAMPAELSTKIELAITSLNQHALTRGESRSLQTDVFLGCFAPAPKVGFLFPGQGSQRVGMCHVLLRRHAWLESQLQHRDASLQKFFSQRNNGVEDVVAELNKTLRQTSNAQPALCVASMLWLVYLADLGIMPDVVAGHSLGEISALYASGVLTEAQFLHLSRLRGQLMQNMSKGTGAMIALFTGHESAEKLISELSAEHRSQLSVANYNSPKQCVVSGQSRDAILALQKRAQGAKVRAVVLKVSDAFHSVAMSEAAAEFQSGAKSYLDDTAPGSEEQSATVPIVSSCDAELMSPETLADLPAYLAGQIRKPVRWTQCVEALVESKQCDVMFEVGPGRVLTNLTNDTTEALWNDQKQQASPRPIAYAMEPKIGTSRGYLTGLARLAISDMKVKYTRLLQGRFFREFVPWTAKHFLVNPCESKNFPEEADFVRGIAPKAGTTDAVAAAASAHSDVEQESSECGVDDTKDVSGDDEASATEANDAKTGMVKKIMDTLINVAQEVSGLDAYSHSSMDDINLDSIKRARVISDTAEAVGMVGLVNPTSAAFSNAESLQEIADMLLVVYEDALESGAMTHTAAETSEDAAEKERMQRRKQNRHDWVEMFSDTWEPCDLASLVAGQDENSDAAPHAVAAHGVAGVSWAPDASSAPSEFGASVCEAIGIQADRCINFDGKSLNSTPAASWLADCEVLVVTVPSKSDTAFLPLGAHLHDVEQMRQLAAGSMSYFGDLGRFVKNEWIPQRTAAVKARNDSKHSGAIGKPAVLFVAHTDTVSPVRAIASTMLLENEGAINVCVHMHTGDSSSLDHTLLHKLVTDAPHRRQFQVTRWSALSGFEYCYYGRVEDKTADVQLASKLLVADPNHGEPAILVPGGGRGVTGRCAVEIARDANVSNLLLIGKSPGTHPEVKAQIEYCASVGITAHYESCNITKPDECARLLTVSTDLKWDVRGLIHGAAINKAVALDEIKADDALWQMSPKVFGIINLLKVFHDDREQRLSLIVCLSSIIAATGMYSAAIYGWSNQIMDTVAHARASATTRVVSARYSLWSGAGMAERMGSVGIMTSMGMVPLTVANGARSLAHLICCSPSQNSVNAIVTSRTGNLATWLLPACEQGDPDERRLCAAYQHAYIDNLWAFTKGVEAVAETNFDILRDDYLMSHVINSSVVVPGVILLELATQVACIMQSLPFSQTDRVALTDIRFVRAIDVPRRSSENVEIDVHTERLSTACKRFVIRPTKAGPDVIACSGQVQTFASSSRGDAGDSKIDGQLSGAGMAFWTKLSASQRLNNPLHLSPIHDLYNEADLLFHGPLFARIKQVYKIIWNDKDGLGEAIAAIERNDSAALNTVRDDTEIVLGDPFYRDAIFQITLMCVPQYACLPKSIGKLVVNCNRSYTGDTIVRMRTRRVQPIDSKYPEFVSQATIIGFEDPVAKTGAFVLETWTDIVFSVMTMKPHNPAAMDLVHPTDRDSKMLSQQLEEMADIMLVSAPSTALRSGAAYHSTDKDTRHKLQHQMLAELVPDSVSGAVEMSWTANGCPSISHGGSISVTHSDSVMVVAVDSKGAPNGIDLCEVSHETNYAKLMPDRKKELMDLRIEGDSEPLAGARLWAVLEAVFKVNQDISDTTVQTKNRYKSCVLSSVTTNWKEGVVHHYVLSIVVPFTVGPPCVFATIVHRIPNVFSGPLDPIKLGIAFDVSRVSDGPGGQVLFAVRHGLTFRDVTSPMKRVSFSKCLELLGHTREQSIRLVPSVYEKLCERIGTGTYGSVTDAVSMTMFGSPRVTDVVEIDFWETSTTDTSTSFRADFFCTVTRDSPDGKTGTDHETVREKFASATIDISSVRVVGQAAALMPWPKFFYRFINCMVPWEEAKPESVHIDPVPAHLTGRSLAHVSDDLPVLMEHFIHTTWEDSNFVGNTYFARYPCWQREAIDAFLTSIDPSFTAANNDHEFLIVQDDLDFQNETFAGQFLVAKVHLRTVYESALELEVVFERVGTDSGSGARRMSHFADHTQNEYLGTAKCTIAYVTFEKSSINAIPVQSLPKTLLSYLESYGIYTNDTTANRRRTMANLVSSVMK
jgi:enediyne polyketide synthase